MKKTKRIVFLALAVALLLTACGAADNMAPATAEAPPSHAEPEAASDTAFRYAVPTEAPSSIFAVAEDAADFDTGFLAEESTDIFTLPIITPGEANGQRWAYSVSMHLQTPEFLPGVQLLTHTIDAMNGELDFMILQGHDIRSHRRAERNVSMRLLIPTEEMTAFVYLIQNNFNMLDFEQHRQNETARHQSTDWTLDDLREEESWLLERLEDAEGDAYQALSATLRDVRSMIRELEATQTAQARDVVFSTVDIQLFEAFFPQETTTEVSDFVFVALGLGLLVLVILLIVTIRRRKQRRLAQLEQQSAAQAATNMPKVVESGDL